MRKIFTLLMFVTTAGTFACGPYFPISYLAQEEPRTISLNLRYDIELLVKQYYPETMNFDFSKSGNMSTREATSKDFGDNPYLTQYLEFDTICRNGVIPESISEVPVNLREFYLYSAGYAEMSGNKDVYFPRYWQELLELPPKQRHYRTTWVYYMLGNLALKRDADEAFEYYQKLRKAISHDGFADSPGLAKRSYIVNFQEVTDSRKKLKYYAIALANNKEVSFFGLSKLARNVSKEISDGDWEKNLFFLELYLMSGGDSWKILEKIDKNTKIYIAERLAAIDYFGNKLESCRKLLEFVPNDSLIKLYLEARFAKREGKTKVAAEKLAWWLKVYRESDTVKFRPQDWFSEYGKVTFKQEVKGVLGTILVEQSDFLEALHAFMEAGSWNDAAIVAEEYVRTKDLTEYCTNHTEADSPLRYLLARRLMREGKVVEAETWFPEQVKELYRLYADLSVLANDPAKIANERALALFELGCLLFRKGLELRGTEAYPDNFIMEGMYEMPADNWRQTSRLAPERQTTMVKRRFHYRWVASGMFARAALLSTSPNLRSASLWAAGEIIRLRAPEDADVYYKMLCDSGEAPLAATARKLHWFPPCPELGKLIRPKNFNRRLQLSDFEFMSKY